MKRKAVVAGSLLAAALSCSPSIGTAQERVVYKCPNNLYTDTLSAKEAVAQGCKALDGSPISVIQSPLRRTPAPAVDATSRPTETRISPADQRARDSDKRSILEAELKREEDRLISLKQEYAGGQPERRGDEKNYQKYLDRVSELKAAIDRSESDVAALRRELGKLVSG